MALGRNHVNPFTPDSGKSKINTNSKLTNKQHHSKVHFSNEWSHFWVLSIESKVRTLCITQGSQRVNRVTINCHIFVCISNSRVEFDAMSRIVGSLLQSPMTFSVTKMFQRAL